MDREMLIFGAGNIGRGFLAEHAFLAGYHVTFVDVAEAIVARLNERGAYTLRLLEDPPRDVTIGPVQAIPAGDDEAVVQAIVKADLAATAVGNANLQAVAHQIAAGLAARADAGRKDPLDVLLAENFAGVGARMRQWVTEALPRDKTALVDRLGTVETVISRMAPIQDAPENSPDPTFIRVEPYRKLPVCRHHFKGPLPPFPDMEEHDDLRPYVERKLFAHNLSHAVFAYAGHQRGHEFLWQCVNDPQVHASAAAAAWEAGDALLKRWHFTRAEHQAHLDDLFVRFANRALGDQVRRVGRDPMRKLGPNDRLVGGARLAESEGIKPLAIARGIACALHYDQPDDASACQLQEIIRSGGLDAALREVCRIDPAEPLAVRVREAYEEIKEENKG